jgi:hypothetical protein
MPILSRAIPAPGIGSGGGGSRVYGQPLAGFIDGVNLAFTTAIAFVPGSEAVYHNGVRQLFGGGNDYTRTESGGPGSGYDTVVFAVAPRSGDNLQIDFDTV